MVYRYTVGTHALTLDGGLMAYTGAIPFDGPFLAADWPLVFDAAGLVVIDGPSWFPDPPKPKPRWSLDLCRDWERLAICEAFDFNGIRRRNTAGEFTLSTSPPGIVGGEYLNQLTALVEDFNPRDVNTVRLVAEGRIVYSGVVGGDSGGFTISRDVNGERWQWAGKDAWHYLSGVLAYPATTSEDPWAVTHDMRTGVASSVIAAYLQNNIGPGAITTRQRPIVIRDDVVGSNLTFSARLQRFDELVSRIAGDGGVEVFVDVDYARALNVHLTAFRDLSDVIVLSDQGDLPASSARFIPRSATRTLTGGSGTGTSRIFRTADTGAVGAARREQFSDQTSFASADEVQADADVKNLLAQESFAIVTELTDEVASGVIRSGLRIGDIISVNIGCCRYSVPIEAMSFEVNAARQVMRPLLGTGQPDELRQLLRDVAGLAARFDNAIA